MNRTFDVAVIGGGPGGYTAALYAARSGYRVAVLEKLSAGGQMAATDTIDNYPGFADGIDGFALGEQMRRGAERFGAVTLYETAQSFALHTSPKKIGTAAGTILAKAVVLAMGASPKKLGIAGEDELRGQGIAYCAACDGMRYRGGTVAVCGGGNSAVADALYLSKLCKKVYLVHRRDTLRAAKVYLQALKDSGVEILWNQTVQTLLYDRKLTGIDLADTVTKNMRRLPCDALFVAIGRVPDTAALQGQLPLDGSGYIVADETTKTPIAGVFAVGDVRTKPLRQIVTATADGATASYYIEEYLH